MKIKSSLTSIKQSIKHQILTSQNKTKLYQQQMYKTIPKQVRRRVQDLNYTACDKPGHEGQQLSLVCLNQQCQKNRLACCHCQQESHRHHFLLPFKQYLVHVYRHKLYANQQSSIQFSNDLTTQVSPKVQSSRINYLFYIKSIQDSKISALKQLQQLKQKMFDRISDLEAKIQINSNKYIEKIMLMSKIYYESDDLVTKLTNFANKPYKISNIIDTYVDNILPPQQTSLNQQQSTAKCQYSNQDNQQATNRKSVQNQFVKIFQSFNSKISNFKKSLNKLDLTLFPELSRIIQYENITFSIGRMYEWDPSHKSKNFQIVDPNNKAIRAKINCTKAERTALMRIDFPSNSKTTYTWAIKINKLLGWVGLGVAFRKITKQYEYKFYPASTEHGSYLMSGNGYTWSHSSSDDNSKMQGFTFLTGDIIVLQYNPQKRQLLFRKVDYNGNNQSKILKIAQTPNDDALCPCVNMCVANDEVEIVPVPLGYY